MSKIVERQHQKDILVGLRQKRQLIEISDLDYKRMLKAAVVEKIPQRVVAETVGISQPAVAKAMKSAASVVDALEGHDAASPYEVCQRYAAGLIGREKLIQELAEWPYPPMPSADEYGDYSEPIEGTFSDVSHAKHMGLIDSGIYAEIVARFIA